MNSTGPTVKREGVGLGGWRATALGIAVAIAGATVITLVGAGFVLAGWLDASGATSVPGMVWLARLPAPVRLAIEIPIGVPIVFGAALYVITQLIELAEMVSWPFRKVIDASRGQN